MKISARLILASSIATLVPALACGPSDSEPKARAAAAPSATPTRTAAPATAARPAPATKRIDFGTPAARPHLVAGWGIDQIQDQRTWVWELGPEAKLQFQAQPAATAVTARAWRKPGSPTQPVTLAINGKPVGSADVKPGQNQLRWTIPAGALVSGRNEASLTTAAAKGEQAVAWMELQFQPLR